MSRPRKRNREEIDCDGCGCASRDCASCPASSELLSSLPPGPPSYLIVSPYQQPPLFPPSDPASIAVVNAGPAYAQMVSQLDENTVRLMLATFATLSTPTQASIRRAITLAYQEQVAGERVIDFSDFSRRAWHVLNTSEYTQGSGSKQYEASFEARSEVIGCIEAIGKEAAVDSSYGTKLSALETLRKIAKTILLAGDTLGREVRMEFQHETCLADIMVCIADSMTPDEQLRAGATADAKGSLAAKLEWVCDETAAHCLAGVEGLRHVLALLTTGAPESDGDSDSSEEAE
ncbi:hypothetical protein ANO14919_063340 [Xylariales sp. No.14919]|nr:hypothetical protein ANO14919_063340 [Xylariales sp. No.14919]